MLEKQEAARRVQENVDLGKCVCLRKVLRNFCDVKIEPLAAILC